MIFKVIIITLLILIMLSLVSGMWFLMRDKENSTRTVRALTWRIGLSFVLIVVLFVGLLFGWIQPHV